MHTYANTHLSGGETVKLGGSTNHDSLNIGPANHLAQLAVVLPHSIPAADRIRLLRELASAASDLADEINVRDLEAGAA